MKLIPAPAVSGDLVEALDLLNDTRGFLELLAMACRHTDHEDRHALDTGLAAALDRLRQAETLLQGQMAPAAREAA